MGNNSTIYIASGHLVSNIKVAWEDEHTGKEAILVFLCRVKAE